MTLVSWLVATAMLAATIPVAWAQHTLVDVDGFTALAKRVAADPASQSAVAGELTGRMVQLIRSGGYDIDPVSVHSVTAAYAAGPGFPAQFVRAAGAAHRWIFTGRGGGEWAVDLAPMLDDSGFQELLADYGVQVPATLAVPLAAPTPGSPRAGQLRPLAVWGPWVSLAAEVLSGGCALLTLVAARRRGRALTALGVSALLAAASGWVGVEVARRHLDDLLNGALDATGVDIRRIADVVVAEAVESLHRWLGLTLAAGGVLVASGVLVALVGGWRRS